VYRAVLTLAWFAGTIYATIPLFSLAVRPLAKFLRARAHSPLRVLIPSWFIMMVFVYLVTWPWREAVLYRAPLAWLASVFLFGAAIVIYHRSRLGFSHGPLGGGLTQFAMFAEPHLGFPKGRVLVAHQAGMASNCGCVNWC
jgi:hypothetical protein